MNDERTIQHIGENIETRLHQEVDWPRYAVTRIPGETEDDVVPAYYRVEGPNGPVRYVNPESDAPYPTTMYQLLMDAQACDFEWVPRRLTPFPQFEDNDTEYYYGDEHDSVAHVLAEETGRPVEDFQPDYDEYPPLDPEDLTTTCADCGKVLGDRATTRDGHECGGSDE